MRAIWLAALMAQAVSGATLAAASVQRIRCDGTVYEPHGESSFAKGVMELELVNPSLESLLRMRLPRAVPKGFLEIYVFNAASIEEIKSAGGTIRIAGGLTSRKGDDFWLEIPSSLIGQASPKASLRALTYTQDGELRYDLDCVSTIEMR